MNVPLWKRLQRETFTNWQDLADFLELSEEQRTSIEPKSPFICQVPRRLAEKIEKRTLNDPLLRQFLPLKKERENHPLFVKDPVKESACHSQPKLLHKYHGRTLLVTTSACAMHCRYCFRQHFPYETTISGYEAELSYLAADPTIHEVILSGGDPLSLDDSKLGPLLDAIDAIPHIQRIRFHTRFPIGIPERIDASFLLLIEKRKKPPVFVFHINHANELGPDLTRPLRELQKHGVLLLNQACLLRGVNDSVDALEQLSQALLDHGIVPYYLHQLDRVAGTAHFEVPEEEGRALVTELRKRLPGYAVPTYVREEPGEPSKTPL